MAAARHIEPEATTGVAAEKRMSDISDTVRFSAVLFSSITGSEKEGVIVWSWLFYKYTLYCKKNVYCKIIKYTLH